MNKDKMKRSFVMLAQRYDPLRDNVSGWYLSEKRDGIRAIWDGGISQGIPTRLVPWANTAKDARLIYEPVSTGLWTRYGHVIDAPGWWLDMLPVGMILDGELVGGSWQDTSKIVKRQLRNVDEIGGISKWEKVKYWIIDSPGVENIWGKGLINETNFKKDMGGVGKWVRDKYKYMEWKMRARATEFEFNYQYIVNLGIENDIVKLIEQKRLSGRSTVAREEIEREMENIIEKEGEGIVLRSPYSVWVPERGRNLLKVKDIKDGEGVVIGYTWGKGKLSGLMGNLILNYKGKRLELSGFTDLERRMTGKKGEIIKGDSIVGGEIEDGEKIDINKWSNDMFPIGKIVSFKYREVSEAGIPKEARFWR